MKTAITETFVLLEQIKDENGPHFLRTFPNEAETVTVATQLMLKSSPNKRYIIHATTYKVLEFPVASGGGYYHGFEEDKMSE